jgi:hypothetical protein
LFVQVQTASFEQPPGSHVPIAVHPAIGITRYAAPGGVPPVDRVNGCDSEVRVMIRVLNPIVTNAVMRSDDIP